MCFVNSVIYEFTRGQANEDHEFIIPPWLFKNKKKIVLLEKLYCLKNDTSSKQFFRTFDEFTYDKFDESKN